MNRITLIIDYDLHKPYLKIGASYTKEDITQYYITPNSLDEVVSAIRHNIQTDIVRLSSWFRKIQYKCIELQEMYRNNKRYVVATFILVALTGINSVFPTNDSKDAVHVNTSNKEQIVYTSNLLVGEQVTTHTVKVKKTIRTKVTLPKVITTLQLSNCVDSLSKCVLYEAGDKYNGVKAEQLPDPITNNIKKFSSYKDAIIYLYTVGKLHNRTSLNTINVMGWLCQNAIEMGLRPSRGGYVSKLGTHADNPSGLKTFNVEDKCVWSKDDDKDKWGRLKHSRFHIFKDYQEAVDKYAEVVSKQRYDSKNRYLQDADFRQYIHELRKDGYCTAPEGQYERQTSVAYTEIAPVLKEAGLIK